MYLVHAPALIERLYRDRVWSMPSSQKVLYLTFDDGPEASVTPWVLDTLRDHGAQATFFVIGRNAQQHPTLLERARLEGHSIGNHTWQHLNGWRTPLADYLADIDRTQSITGTRLFRPPYGRITRVQVQALAGRFDVIMWKVLSADFDEQLDGERCAHNVIRNARAGSIVVFHDSLKAEPRLRLALRRTLEHFGREGYAFKALPEEGVKAARR